MRIIAIAALALALSPGMAFAGQHGHGGHAGKGDRHHEGRDDQPGHVAPNHTREVGPATSGEPGHPGVLTGGDG